MTVGLTDALIETVRASVIGGDELVDGPFGRRPVIYADYTASGRSLTFIEDYLRDAVLPLYANTHTESSGTGRQTSRFRRDARSIIGRCVGADEDEHVVLFCGSGCTAAIDKMVGVLGIRIPSALDDSLHLSDTIAEADRPVVFIGPYEHHSNELVWRESIADVVTIPEDTDGHVSLAELDAQLTRFAERPLKIGSFSAASNVTGILTDVAAVSSLLHAHGALAMWDYAAAAPYVSIRMGSGRGGAADGTHLDAVFISTHKMIGGPGTPGVLVARRELFGNRVPVVPGGGTVAYVNPQDHRYLDAIEAREEGGTPAIVESIRAGLVFQLKEAVGVEAIRAAEASFVERAIDRWDRTPGIEILGSREAERLSIVSFVVRSGDRYLHHNFVVALLNDLFGIQSRGGCSCAGPYGHRLLGIDLEHSHQFERQIAGGCEGIKPGWVRVNFNYFIDEATFDYVLSAVELVATRGHEALPYYSFDTTTGIWAHRESTLVAPMSLHDVSYEGGRMSYPTVRHEVPSSGLSEFLVDAESVLDAAPRVEPDGVNAGARRESDDFEALRWFWYPWERVE